MRKGLTPDKFFSVISRFLFGTRRRRVRTRVKRWRVVNRYTRANPYQTYDARPGQNVPPPGMDTNERPNLTAIHRPSFLHGWGNPRLA